MSDSKPYRSGPPLRTGDRVGVEIGDQRFEGTAQVESGPYGRQKITIIPDGEPMLYARDYAFAAMPDWLPEKPSNVELVEADIPAIDEDLKITAHRWLPREPIPYDEMRRLCGLDPAVKAYCARRDMQKSFNEIGKAINQVATDIGKGFERFADALIESKPKSTPPMWADNPAGQRRPTKTRNHRRVK
ncbi:hypothetical protein ACMTN4_07430 [Rhodococcus globerulus]|uniref:hypothetical protein n=1 Tax=Rhodococcus globerulus TaxID=33008 RepID=UPI0039EB9F95